MREFLAEFTAPPVLVYPNGDAVADYSRPFLLYCDGSGDGLGATVDEEQCDHTIRLIVLISRAATTSGRHWTPLDLYAASIAWDIERLRSYLWGTKF